MIEIASLVSICKTAVETGKQAAEAYRKKKLSGAEEELLVTPLGVARARPPARA